MSSSSITAAERRTANIMAHFMASAETHIDNSNRRDINREPEPFTIPVREQPRPACDYRDDAVVQDLNLPVKLLAMGRYLPSQHITTEQLEARFPHWTPGWVKKNLGVLARYRADKKKGESQSYMAARAVEDAVKNAGIKLTDLDCIINASALGERPIPDQGALIQRHLGLGKSGIPCFTVHATCMSFVVAYNVASSMINSGAYRTVAVVSSEHCPDEGLDWDNMHNSALFGDVSAAAILTRAAPTENSKFVRFYQKTWGDYFELATIPGGGTAPHPFSAGAKRKDLTFQMQGPKLLEWAVFNMPAFMDKVMPGVFDDDLVWDDTKCIILHQASKKGLNAWKGMLPAHQRHKVFEAFEQYGNCISASIPNTLYEAIHTGRVQRGDKVLLFGTGAGLSIVAAQIVY
ncbi:hypothetical protein HK102_014154 [Quaeritorhiza haematococci]|nr:hypothetical protein HK102_014154 [Quaeritorhiza haematococci]